ncbi:MAG: phosphatidate cytidylyltransferase [Dokdonella sp.]|uniref:phosphatidate cytidylyltransferase n=1 Tax=Dokdonella sp. TaxID=2291710 RepID=UPI0025C44F83|nr:phosphatidate cytidylyltransferase [Dokdonella sp.]MBZ0222963.1 phosphatidate cytidylyltransferase [Dokdonella sp.]
MLKQRTITALILTPLAIAAVLLSPTWVFALIVAALFLGAAWEWSALAGLQGSTLRLGFVLASAALFALAWSLHGSVAAACVIALGVGFWLLTLLWLRHFSWAAAPTRENLLLKLLACELAIIPAWLALMQLHAQTPHGPWWTLFAVMLVWAADTGAYFAGVRFGTTKLAPRISPNKTRAGLWGALGLGGAVALVGGWMLGWRDGWLAALLVLALLVVLASVVGDLIESLLKRQANVKDSGALFPGHGGLLDRADSLLAALPVFAAGKALIELLRQS